MRLIHLKASLGGGCQGIFLISGITALGVMLGWYLSGLGPSVNPFIEGFGGFRVLGKSRFRGIRNAALEVQLSGFGPWASRLCGQAASILRDMKMRQALGDHAGTDMGACDVRSHERSVFASGCVVYSA